MFGTHAPSDTIQLLEALYDLEQPRNTWLRNVLKAAGSAFDRGAGVGIVLYDVSGETPRVDAIDGINLPDGHLEVGIDIHQQPGFARWIVSGYRNDICTTFADHVSDSEQTQLRDRYAQVGVEDQIRLNGANPSGLGCALYVFSKTRLSLDAGERALMMRLATHLATAYRLQCRLADWQAVT
jgi:hypothetical protein